MTRRCRIADRGPLRRLAAAALLAIACPASAESVADWHPFVIEASLRFGLPVPWIERVMQAESAGRTTLNGLPIVSRAGAIGLMQLMPDCWRDMRGALRLGGDPFDPHDNILAGTAYLRLLYDRFGYPGLFAAYNAGPARYGEYLAGRRRLPAETRTYLVSVAGARRGGPVVARAPRADRLFVSLAAESLDPSPAHAPGLGTGLFAIPPAR